jgi:hypothetical protein
MELTGNALDVMTKMGRFVYQLYGLTEEEVRIVEGKEQRNKHKS